MVWAFHSLHLPLINCYSNSRGAKIGVDMQAEQHQLMRKAFHYAT